MDVTAVRWESLLFVIALGVLATWALFGTAEASVSESGTDSLALQVEVRRPGVAPEVLTLSDGGLIGRSRECDIVIDDGTVSKQHARLSIEQGQPFVEDLHSTNGTSLNGSFLQEKTRLRRGDRIGLGSNLIVLVGVSPALNRRQQ